MRPGEKITRTSVAMLLVAAFALAVSGCSTPGTRSDRSAEEPREAETERELLRFGYSGSSGDGGGHPPLRLSGQGWIDPSRNMVRATETYGLNGDDFRRETLVVDDVVYEVRTEPDGKTYYEKDDSTSLPTPFAYIRSYETEVTQGRGTPEPGEGGTVRVRLLEPPGTVSTTVLVRPGDFLPVRISLGAVGDGYRGARRPAATIYNVRVTRVPSDKVPDDVFTLDYPE